MLYQPPDHDSADHFSADAHDDVGPCELGVAYEAGAVEKDAGVYGRGEGRGEQDARRELIFRESVHGIVDELANEECQAAGEGERPAAGYIGQKQRDAHSDQNLVSDLALREIAGDQYKARYDGHGVKGPSR